MSLDSNKATSRRWYLELFNLGDLAVADQICAETYTNHDPYGPPGGWPIGPTGAKAVVTIYRTAFPDVAFTVEEQIAEDNSVATRWTARGTQNGLLPGGITPTGKPVYVTGISIEHYENGKIVESRVNWDFMGMMQQLGVIPSPGASPDQSTAARSTNARSQMKATLVALGLVILGVTGCQSTATSPTATLTLASSPAPAATAVIPTATATPVTPTATATPVEPTATATQAPPTPTASPTALPPIPAADFALVDILGTWTRSDRDRGELFLSFLEEGGYTASHGTPDGVVHAGAYTLEGRLLTFQDGWNCSPLPNDTPGRYVLRLANAGKWLFLDIYEDTCPDRPNALESYRWTRFVPTATPTP